MWADVLKQVAAGKKCLLMLDFDGTLIPLAPNPYAITVPKEVAPLLTALQNAGHCVWIITGRRMSDVVNRLKNGIPVIGLHGLEWPDKPIPKPHHNLDLARERAQAIANDFPGAIFEDKHYSVALHTRQIDAGLRQAAAKQAMDAFHELTNESLSYVFPV